MYIVYHKLTSFDYKFIVTCFCCFFCTCILFVPESILCMLVVTYYIDNMLIVLLFYVNKHIVQPAHV